MKQPMNNRVAVRHPLAPTDAAMGGHVRTDTTDGRTDVPLASASGARRKVSITSETLTERQVRGRAQRDIIAAIAAALTRHAYPPMDTRLKSIVASQLRHLVGGGYDAETVKHLAIETALQYDDKRGHNRLCHLAARVRVEFEQARTEEHERRKREEAQAGPASPMTRADLIAEADAMDARGEESWMLRRALAKHSRKVICPRCSGVYFLPGNGTYLACGFDGSDHAAQTGVAS